LVGAILPNHPLPLQLLFSIYNVFLFSVFQEQELVVLVALALAVLAPALVALVLTPVVPLPMLAQDVKRADQKVLGCHQVAFLTLLIFHFLRSCPIVYTKFSLDFQGEKKIGG